MSDRDTKVSADAICIAAAVLPKSGPSEPARNRGAVQDAIALAREVERQLAAARGGAQESGRASVGTDGQVAPGLAPVTEGDGKPQTLAPTSGFDSHSPTSLDELRAKYQKQGFSYQLEDDLIAALEAELKFAKEAGNARLEAVHESSLAFAKMQRERAEAAEAKLRERGGEG